MFKVGDDVTLVNVLGDDGEYAGDSITEKGRVMELFSPRMDYRVRVKWDNGNVYRYKEVDLDHYALTLENE